MNTTLFVPTILTVAFLSTTLAQGQEYRSTPNPVRSPAVFYRHASTVYEGWLRGRADLLRARGEYNYNSSLANIHDQEAYRRFLDNQVKKTDTYFKMREINREARAAERGPRLTREEMIRNAKRSAPKRLTSYEYQPALGAIRWPAVLTGGEFTEGRAAVDRLIAQRTAANSGQGTANHQLIKGFTVRMQQQLKERIDSINPSDYITAKKFLTRVEFEARHQLDAEGLASTR